MYVVFAGVVSAFSAWLIGRSRAVEPAALSVPLRPAR
jgi:hypothetical protein